ncbi:MAG TPA: hypothetical protein VL688_05880 [Verrucomicrobiae bacterium]|jgi:hypothetical protein|nr:hypothetical protein [Verrucomicrobiae bacterium]
MTRKISFLMLGVFLSLAARAAAAEAPAPQDPAWEYYIKSQKKIQVAFHHLVRLHLHDLKDLIQDSLEYQLAVADQKSERFYYLMTHAPERIVRNQGFNAFVNFPWTGEDEAAIAAGSKVFRKRQKALDKLKQKVEGDPNYQTILTQLSSLSRDNDYQHIQARFRYVPQGVESILAGKGIPDDASDF